MILTLIKKVYLILKKIKLMKLKKFPKMKIALIIKYLLIQIKIMNKKIILIPI